MLVSNGIALYETMVSVDEAIFGVRLRLEKEKKMAARKVGARVEVRYILSSMCFYV